MKTLIAYYSRNGENYFGGVLKKISIGNTEVVAKLIQEETDGDLFHIEQIQPYSDDYNTCIKQAEDDKKRNARPELKTNLESIEDYDVIYLGYPNYWGTVPMAVLTFLESQDLTGKTIKPFCTHEGSGLGRSVDDLRKLFPNVTIQDGLAIQGSQASNASSKIKGWVKE